MKTLKLTILFLIITLSSCNLEELNYYQNLNNQDENTQDTINLKDTTLLDFEKFNKGQRLFYVEDICFISSFNHHQTVNTSMIEKTKTKLNNILISSKDLDTDYPNSPIDGSNINLVYPSIAETFYSFDLYDKNKRGGYYEIIYSNEHEEIIAIEPPNHVISTINVGAKDVVKISIYLYSIGGIDNIKLNLKNNKK